MLAPIRGAGTSQTQQAIYELDHCAASSDRETRLVLSDGPSRLVGLGSGYGTGALRCHGQRQDDQGSRIWRSGRLNIHRGRTSEALEISRRPEIWSSRGATPAISTRSMLALGSRSSSTQELAASGPAHSPTRLEENSTWRSWRPTRFSRLRCHSRASPNLPRAFQRLLSCGFWFALTGRTGGLRDGSVSLESHSSRGETVGRQSNPGAGSRESAVEACHRPRT